MIRRVLIANRGEIAIRVARACRELGIETVAIHSTADRAAPHTLAADRALEIGPAPAADSYLAVDRVLDAARAAGADAIHPGYGFLSENPAFARACEKAGVIFVGPPADVLDLMGSKIAARALAERAGVPVVPGHTPGDQTDAGVLAAARTVGFPALIKASAGGGGKGMRIARAEGDALEALQSARRESTAAFGDGTLYVERLIERPHHVEVQIFGDAAGNVVHLFERDCSVQRRHQKIVEESPSPVVTARLRARIGDAAVALASAAGYRNAGTIEFLLEGAGDEARFYFLEMNTRLQVEHGVTESVTGVDLVRAQLLVAGGARLPWRQEDLTQRGHAVECRVYAEDPGHDFVPQAGRIALYREPSGPGIRVDSGIFEGADVPVHYDPLIAKVIAHAETREAALARMTQALRSYPILGVRTNVPFLLRLIAHSRFVSGGVDTSFVDAELEALVSSSDDSKRAAAEAVAAVVRGAAGRGEGAGAPPTSDPWETLRDWRG